MRRSLKKTNFLISCFFLLSACEDPNPKASQALLSAFSNSCTSSGHWTQAALAHNQALQSVIQSIQNNDACKPFINILAQIGTATTQIDKLLSDSSYSDYRLAEETIQELALALSTAPAGGALATALSQQLITTQVDLSLKRAKNNSSTDMTNPSHYASATLQLANYTQTLLQSAGSIQSCLQQSPEVAIQMASHLIALGGSFVAPIFGAGGTVVSQLISLVVEIARKRAQNDALWELYKAQVPTALGCGLEAMTELYCDANDAFDLLQLQASAYPHPGSLPNPIWRSLDLQERRLPILTQWLLKVRNGTLPSDPQEAQKQNNAWAKLQALDATSRTVYGDLNHDLALYLAAVGNPIAQQNILVSAISGTSQMLSSGLGSGIPNPFSSLNATLDQFACWIVTGYSTVDGTTVCLTHSPSSGTTGSQYIKTVLIPTYHPKMTDLLHNFNSIFDPVQKQVSLEFAQTVTQDPTPILASALQAGANNPSPREVLVNVKDFLELSLAHDDGKNPQKPPLLQDTLAIVTQGLSIIDDTSSSPATAKVRNLFDIFHLQNGIQFFGNRIGNLIQWDLQDRLRKGEFPKNVAEILKVAGGDIRTRLLESGVTQLDRVTADLNSSRSITFGNIEVYRKFFEPSFANSIKYLDERAKRSGEPDFGPNRPFGQTLGHLCLLFLSSGQKWPISVPWNICSKASLNSIYPDPRGILSIRLDSLKLQLEGKNDQFRFCAYHRFLRAGRLAELLNSQARPSGLDFLHEFLQNVLPGESLENLLESDHTVTWFN